MAAEILLADDDAGLRRVLQHKLERNGYTVTAVADGQAALIQARAHDFDLIITDMKMPGIEGIELLQNVKSLKPDTEVILITAFAEVQLAVRAIKQGAFDYLTKPFDDEELLAAIDKVLRFKSVRDENRLLKQRLDDQSRLNNIAGISPQYRKMQALIKKIAPTEATVLITGESGSGKEVIARAIHAASSRASGGFTAINCAAIPKDLLESELFGHIKGAFTGAVRDKKGKFVLADGGTLLLDEVSELSIELQAKLLRAIQERVIEPVGSENRVEVDLRLLAATNKDLKTEVIKGRFREDLYYRLNVIPLHVPPLRERREDIPVLVKGFLRKLSHGANISVDEALMEALRSYDWPGNIRELENLIERMVILRAGDILSATDLPADFGSKAAAPAVGVQDGPTFGRVSFREAEKNLIIDALNRCYWNKSQAAAYLEIPRHVLVYRMKKYNISNRDDAAHQTS